MNNIMNNCFEIVTDEESNPFLQNPIHELRATMLVMRDFCSMCGGCTNQLTYHANDVRVSTR